MEQARQPIGWYVTALRLNPQEEATLTKALHERDCTVVADVAATTIQRATEMTAATEQMLHAAGWSSSAVSLFMIGEREVDGQ